MPWIINSGKTTSIIQTRAMLIIREKRPKVITLKGRVIRLRIGFTKKLIIPRAIPAMIRYLISPTNSTPGTNFTASQRPAVAAIAWNINLTMIFYDSKDLAFEQGFFSEPFVIANSKPVGLIPQLQNKIEDFSG